MPTPVRYAASSTNDRASPEAAVIALQNRSPTEIRLRRTQTSANLASGMPNTA